MQERRHLKSSEAATARFEKCSATPWRKSLRWRAGSLREVRGRVRLLERRLGDGSLGSLSLRQREWNRADAQKQKEVKRTSNQVTL